MFKKPASASAYTGLEPIKHSRVNGVGADHSGLDVPLVTLRPQLGLEGFMGAHGTELGSAIVHHFVGTCNSEG